MDAHKQKIENLNESELNEISDKTDPLDLSIKMSPSMDSDEGYVCSEDETPQPNDINFSITLSYSVWQTIKPAAKQCRRNDKTHKTNVRVYYNLQAGLWTNTLIKRIADHRIKNPCTWSFKRSKSYPNGKTYIATWAKCTTCGALLIGQLKNEPEESDEIVKFQFIIRGFNEKKHMEGRKNVRIGGSKANEIFSSTKKASVLK